MIHNDIDIECCDFRVCISSNNIKNIKQYDTIIRDVQNFMQDCVITLIFKPRYRFISYDDVYDWTNADVKDFVNQFYNIFKSMIMKIIRVDYNNKKGYEINNIFYDRCMLEKYIKKIRIFYVKFAEILVKLSETKI